MPLPIQTVEEVKAIQAPNIMGRKFALYVGTIQNGTLHGPFTRDEAVEAYEKYRVNHSVTFLPLRTEEGSLNHN